MSHPEGVGVLLINLGTPDAPDATAVRRYLREFLSDPRVIDLAPPARWLLLNAVILPFRPKQSAAAYRHVWTDEGSPLLVESERLRDAVAARLPQATVALGMRYGSPSLEHALDQLRAAGCERLVVFPLYPQYASSSTGSSLEAVYRLVAERWNTPSVAVVPPFYDDPGFIEACAAVGRPILDELAPDHVLMSFHGLPERHIRKSDAAGGHCLASAGCCDRMQPANRACYRAQCFATARALAGALQLAPDTWSVSFQSRLGRTPWIQPYTDEVLPALAARGARRVAVYCPAFVADCLETLEEIGLRAEADFRAAGGEALRLIPAVNSHPRWVDAVVDLLGRTAGWLDAAA